MRSPDNCQHWPGAVEMFVASGTPHFHAMTFHDEKRVGGTTMFAKDEADAEAQAWRIFHRCVSGGRCGADRINRIVVRRMTVGETAACITGARV